MNIMDCYISRDGAKAAVGGQFITDDGSYRMIPDRFLHEALINHDDTMLMLYYRSWTIKIAGFRLRKVYEDTVDGRLGKITIADPADDMETAEAAETPFVTNITHFFMSPEAANDLERNN
jgi:hypothetical protein